MYMENKDLRQNRRNANLFTAPKTIARLLDLMARWWNGESLAQMASVHGISRQRVRAILQRVGCKQALRSAKHLQRPDSSHRPPPARVEMANRILAHPRVHRLTVRQLAAVAWTAQGLMSRDIAKRMQITPQSVLQLLVVALRRLEQRLQRQEHPADPETSAPELPPIDWSALQQSIVTHEQH
jgi:DNA-binding CsgD family transcriptional regulator